MTKLRFAIVGHTGFVGSNILNGYNLWVKNETTYEASIDLYNSKNVQEIEGKEYDILILACLPGNVNIANRFPEKDLQSMEDVLNNIKLVKSAKYVFLMSTIFVLNDDTYGIHRLQFEKHVQEIFTKENKNTKQLLIYRLPGIFGDNLKKNIIYDFKHPAPPFIKAEKMENWLMIMPSWQKSIMLEAYKKNEQLNQYDLAKSSPELIEILKALGFTSLSFWHPEDEFVWYDIRNLFDNIINMYGFAQIKKQHNPEIKVFTNGGVITAREIAEAVGVDTNLLKANTKTRIVDYKKHFGTSVKVIPKSKMITEIVKFIKKQD